MDITTMRIVATLVSMALFIGHLVVGVCPAAIRSVLTKRHSCRFNKTDSPSRTRTSHERFRGTNFWSVYVAGITVVGIIACLVLLIITARKKVVADGDNTTGHVWDEDLRELNNPMPRWWVWMFVITVVFSLLYLLTCQFSSAGKMQWSQVGAYQAEVEKANAELEPLSLYSHEFGRYVQGADKPWLLVSVCS